MRLDEIVGDKGKYILVGMNSQGKTFALQEYYRKHKKTTIFIENETRADEQLKSSTNSSPLVEWLERLLDIKSLQKLISEQIERVNISDNIDYSNLDICLQATVENYKGLVAANIKTKSNRWGKPGSGETFLGQLLLIEQMIGKGNKNPIKCLMIDEPETFLHQTIYPTIIGILKRLSEKMRVIVSTHSPEFLDLYIDNLDEIILVTNGKLNPIFSDQSLIERILEQSLYDVSNPNMDKQTKKIITLLPQYFDQFMKPVIIRTMFSKIIVLGEGVAEDTLFSCVQKRNQNEEFLNYTSFFTVLGKYLMPAYLDIFKLLDLKTIVLFDADAKYSDPWHKKVNESITQLSDDYYCFEDDIETYLRFEKPKNDKSYKGLSVPIMIQSAFLSNDSCLDDLIRALTNKIKSQLNDLLLLLNSNHND